jgi:TRAP transporter 4TM/12TM fusion protein
MIRQGYPRAFAAATEAVASTGGQIMPPIMGAGVFLMASLIQVPYSDLMIVAAPPALLYFLTAWFGVHQTAVAGGIEVASREAIPSWGDVARTLPFFLAPLGVLIVMLVASDYTAGYAGAIATAIAAALLLLDDKLRVSLPRFIERVHEALIAAAEQIAMVASVIVCAGIITGVFHMTGVGVKITSLIVGMAGGQLWVVLVMTALACIALGMELPTTAAYVICISVAGPALGNLGLPPVQAHLFVFWYALLCTLTPPVCGNVFIAASIAETPWLPVAWRAMRLGGGLFVVPLAFVANPALLTFATTPLLTTLATVKVGIGLWFFTYALVGGRGGAWLRVGAAVVSAAVIFAYGF